MFTVFMALLTAAGIAGAYEMAARGKVASARVVRRVPLAKYRTAIVEFTTDTGRYVQVEVQGVGERPGATIPVRYLPDDPVHNVERAGSHSNAFWAGGPALVTIVSAIVTGGLATGRLAIEGKRIVRTRRGSRVRGAAGRG